VGECAAIVERKSNRQGFDSFIDADRARRNQCTDRATPRDDGPTAAPAPSRAAGRDAASTRTNALVRALPRQRAAPRGRSSKDGTTTRRLTPTRPNLEPTSETQLKNLQLWTAGALVLGGLAFAQQAPVAPAAKEASNNYFICTLDKLQGQNVRNDAQKSLGEIGDLLVDPRNGHIRFAIVEAGGVLGIGEEQRIVPFHLLTFSRDADDADKFRITTRITEEQLKTAPKLKKGDPPDADLERRIETVFGKSDMVVKDGALPMAFARASKIDGSNLHTPAGKDIGDIEDLVVAPEVGCIAYAVVDTKDEAGDRKIALPISRMQFAFEEKDKDKLRITTSVEPAKLAAGPVYDAKEVKRVMTTSYVNELCTYYGCEPFWKGRTLEAKGPKQPAPDKKPPEKP
jgi:sporulation protein YlmC with PRC-barrel domain